MQAACSRSGAGNPCRARHVAPVGPCGLQAARRVARASCYVARVAALSGNSGGVQRVPQPSPSDDMYEKVMEDVARMAEKNEDDALSKYLEAWVRNVSLEEGHDLKVARLKKELAATSDWLQQATVNYLHLRGRFNMRGILEHTQARMGVIAGVDWDDANRAACWDQYIAERPALQECLIIKCDVDVAEGGSLLSTIYSTLSTDVQRTTGSKLCIGPPLDQQQRKVMGCICEDADLPYEFVPDLTSDA